MATGQLPIRLSAVEKVFRADWARGQVAALMRGKLHEVHAAVALHAVTGVEAQAGPPPAQIAIWAVIYLATWSIVPQAANRAEVCC